MMESDEEDEGDAEFAVEISKQELVFNSNQGALSQQFLSLGECNKGHGSQAGKPPNLQRPHCETWPCFTGNFWQSWFY